MSSVFSRRTAALVAAPVLALGGLAAVSPAPASAGSTPVPATSDPAPVAHGATWLRSQLTGGVIHNAQYAFDDYGLSIDTGLALDAVARPGTAVDAISTALAAHIGDYVGDGTTESYAGALGKAAVFSKTAGDDPASYGGVDLIARLEARVGTTGATAGRIGDLSAYGDFANPIGQAFAVRALDEAGSSLAGSATTFLTDQQCSDGWFRASFADASATAQTCDADSSSEPSVDVTALAVLQLEGQSDDAAVKIVIEDAVAWLVSVQHADGSFGGSGLTSAPNANSTGLAGWALGDLAQTDAAAQAAVWLRQHQADDFGPCTSGLSGSTGAIAYDDAALAAGRREGLLVPVEDQFRRATAQALVALQYAPAGVHSSKPTSTSGFVRAGSTRKIYADDLAPGQAACFSRGARQDLVSANRAGHAVGRVELPDRTGTYRYTVALTDGVLGVVKFHALAGKRLPVVLKQKVKARAKQVVTVKGLEPGEDVTVSYRTGSKHIGTKGLANASGRFTARFSVGKARGVKKVHVTGQFGNRLATKTFTVIKG